MDAPEGGPEPRRVTWRAAAVLVAIAVLVPVGAFGAARIWNAKPETADESANIEGLLESAEEAMDRRAWDAPPGENVKELTDRALELSPGDRHVLSLRRTAADRILSEALGKKYAGSKEEALRLANLSLSLNPDLAAAQALVKELETPEPIANEGPPEPIAEPSAEPVASASAEASASAAPSASAPPTPSVSASTTAPTPPPSAKPAQKGPAPKGPGPKPPATEDPEEGPDLPPSNPPDITPPGPSSARPWM